MSTGVCGRCRSAARAEQQLLTAARPASPIPRIGSGMILTAFLSAGAFRAAAGKNALQQPTLTTALVVIVCALLMFAGFVVLLTGKVLEWTGVDDTPASPRAVPRVDESTSDRAAPDVSASSPTEIRAADLPRWDQENRS